MGVIAIGHPLRRWVIVIAAVIVVILLVILSSKHKDVTSALSFSIHGRKSGTFDSPEDEIFESKVAGPTEINWKTKNVQSMTPKQIVDYFLWTNQTSCKLSHDFGGKMLKNPSGFDGQKAVCLDTEVAPKAGSCIIYSFGINNEWSFDETMENYGCQVFSFDPSMKKEDHKHSKAISFYNLGLSGKDEVTKAGWKLKTLSSIYLMLKPIHGDVPIDYLKIDIESAEWNAIPEIINSGMLAKVRQLGVEFHWSRTSNLQYFRQRVNIVKAIENAGMIRFDSKYNPWFKGNIPALHYNGSLGYEIAWYQILPYILPLP